MADKISEALAKLTPEDISVDEEGQVIIANEEVADALRKEVFKEARMATNNRCNFGCRPR